MDSYLLRGVRNTTLALATFFLSSFADAADRVLDLSSGCKLYKLENKAWTPADSAAMNGAAIPGAQVVKDAGFFVFRNSGGTFGVNRRCVRAAPGGGNSSSPSAAPAQAQSRPAAKRRSAARPTAAPAEHESPWAVSFGLGMNLAPSGTFEVTEVGVTSPATSMKFKSSLAFQGDASYRMSFLRLAVEIGLSQLSQVSGAGNETSYFAFRPEVPFRLSPSLEAYVGPMVGLYFLSQNAETQNNGTTVIAWKQQTASSILIGLKVGIDYRLSNQFDLGLLLQYFKPGTLKITGTESAPLTGPVETKLTASWLTIGTRFVIHF